MPQNAIAVIKFGNKSVDDNKLIFAKNIVAASLSANGLEYKFDMGQGERLIVSIIDSAHGAYNLTVNKEQFFCGDGQLTATDPLDSLVSKTAEK